MASMPISTAGDITTIPIPQDALQEIEAFEEEVGRVFSEEVSLDLFKPFRLQHGIYGQRQPGVQMVRIKIPFGGLTSNQLRQVADVADRYATGVGHVTTRQDIQLHFVPLQDVGTVMRKLAEVGLTTREACANTVRNVTACHLAGVCPGEVFDVTPSANTIASHLLRNPLTQSLPRKFKIALSGCTKDCALTPIHDIGLLAVKQEGGETGFRMTIGGGLGSAPRTGQVLFGFVPMTTLIPAIEAIIKVFDALGNRKNRHKARMKFVLDKLGIVEFKKRWEEAYRALGHSSIPDGTVSLLRYPDDPVQLIAPSALLSRPRGNGDTPSGNGHTPDGPRFQLWKRTNVVPQKQEEYMVVAAKLPMGDMTSPQMRALSDLADRYANGNLRTTINQNIVLRWVPPSAIEALYRDLASHGLGEPGAEQTEDIIACPGTDTCGLGITSSKGLARAMADIFPAGQVPDDLSGVTIKISGCHNSCAQHHIATLGLHGVGKRLGDHVAPHYELHVGGQVNGKASIAQMVVKLPATNVPKAITHLISVFRTHKTPGEHFKAFLTRWGKGRLKEALIPFTLLPKFEVDSTVYYDWEAEEEFTVEDLGPGECAGGVLEMIGNRILEADQELYQAKLLVGKQQFSVSVNKSYRAVVAGAKALLVTEGLDPATDEETFSEFETRFAHKGILPASYHDVRVQVGDLGPKDSTEAFARQKMSYARGFVDACRTATETMDQALHSQPKHSSVEEGPAPVAPVAGDDHGASAQEVQVYDLRGVMCPLNYVKTKLKLEMMDDGDRLEVWLDAGDPIKNVPMSLRNDGHKVLAEEPLEAEAKHFKVLVEKVEG